MKFARFTFVLLINLSVPVWTIKVELEGKQDSAPSGSYQSIVHAKSMECGDQALELGDLPTVESCDKAVANKQECGRFFMFSKSHTDWKCRCCSPLGEDSGPGSPLWDVYKAQYPRSKSLPALPPTPPSMNPFDGLPVSDKPRPSWLARQDELVVDARPTEHGGILILQAVLSDSHGTWGTRKVTEKADRPDWLRAILATNRAHAKKHGHAMVLRAHPTEPQLTDAMIKDCGTMARHACAKKYERETFNWEKHLMMSDYLLNPQEFTHVLMLDADAAFVQPQLDTLRRMAKILEDQKKSFLLADEDWFDANGKGRINGGMMYAKNTEFTRGLFQDTFAAHVKFLKQGKTGVQDLSCMSNEQICLNDLYYGGNKQYLQPHTILASGKKYNRGAQGGGEAHLTDETTEIMHWMGDSKNSAAMALCSSYGRDLTYEGPQGYGCKPPVVNFLSKTPAFF